MDSKNNSKELQQKYRLGTVSIKVLGGVNRFYVLNQVPVVIPYEYTECVYCNRENRKTKANLMTNNIFFLYRYLTEITI